MIFDFVVTPGTFVVDKAFLVEKCGFDAVEEDVFALGLLPKQLVNAPGNRIRVNVRSITLGSDLPACGVDDVLRLYRMLYVERDPWMTPSPERNSTNILIAGDPPRVDGIALMVQIAKEDGRFFRTLTCTRLAEAMMRPTNWVFRTVR